MYNRLKSQKMKMIQLLDIQYTKIVGFSFGDYI